MIIVDDSLTQRHGIKKCLEAVIKVKHLSYIIEEASDGVRGWDICKEREFNFYVIDYQMPKMNGVVLLRNVLQQNPHAKVVLFSDSQLNEIEQEEGIDLANQIDFIRKDFTKLADFFEKFLNELAPFDHFQTTLKNKVSQE
jgi:CheY-like chemotaxis protein